MQNGRRQAPASDMICEGPDDMIIMSGPPSARGLLPCEVGAAEGPGPLKDPVPQRRNHNRPDLHRHRHTRPKPAAAAAEREGAGVVPGQGGARYADGEEDRLGQTGWDERDHAGWYLEQDVRVVAAAGGAVRRGLAAVDEADLERTAGP